MNIIDTLEEHLFCYFVKKMKISKEVIYIVKKENIIFKATKRMTMKILINF